MTGVEKNMRGRDNLSFLDTHPREASFRSYVMEGLSGEQKCIASKFLYDRRGSGLFDQICNQPEYYQTNAELEILGANAEDMVSGNAPRLLVELGSGHSRKGSLLLACLESNAAYVPIDISRDYLLEHAERVAKVFPHIQVAALCADFLSPLTMPVDLVHYASRIVFFPGSTIGNFEPPTQRKIMANAVAVLRKGGSMIIGVDRKNDRRILEAAYNDAAGITAAFELNLLHRINRELGANFNVEKFFYRGFYNEAAGRVEMFIVSKEAQTVTIDGRAFRFASDEPIHVESSYKYEPEEFAALCRDVGLVLRQTWTDQARQFCVYRLEVE